MSLSYKGLAEKAAHLEQQLEVAHQRDDRQMVPGRSEEHISSDEISRERTSSEDSSDGPSEHSMHIIATLEKRLQELSDRNEVSATTAAFIGGVVYMQLFFFSLFFLPRST